MSKLLITTDLEGIGEVVNAALHAFAAKHEMVLDDDDYMVAGHAAAHNIVFQVERLKFEAEVQADLAALDTQESVTQEGVPNHQPEFGL